MYQEENNLFVKIVSYLNKVEYKHENLFEELENELKFKTFDNIFSVVKSVDPYSNYVKFIQNIKIDKPEEYIKFMDILKSREIKKECETKIENIDSDKEIIKDENKRLTEENDKLKKIKELFKDLSLKENIVIKSYDINALYRKRITILETYLKKYVAANTGDENDKICFDDFYDRYVDFFSNDQYIILPFEIVDHYISQYTTRIIDNEYSKHVPEIKKKFMRQTKFIE